jgi:hypothetical protein
MPMFDLTLSAGALECSTLTAPTRSRRTVRMEVHG